MKDHVLFQGQNKELLNLFETISQIFLTTIPPGKLKRMRKHPQKPNGKEAETSVEALLGRVEFLFSNHDPQG